MSTHLRRRTAWLTGCVKKRSVYCVNRVTPPVDGPCPLNFAARLHFRKVVNGRHSTPLSFTPDFSHERFNHYCVTRQPNQRCPRKSQDQHYFPHSLALLPP